MSRHYHACANTPGYLPVEVSYTFDRGSYAWDFLASEIKEDWDSYIDLDRDFHYSDGLDVNERYETVYAIAITRSTPGVVFVDGGTRTSLGRVYSVTECDDASCLADD